MFDVHFGSGYAGLVLNSHLKGSYKSCASLQNSTHHLLDNSHKRNIKHRKDRKLLSSPCEIMPLARLIYSSKRTEGVEVADILRILDKATQNNKRNDITGFLCYTDNSFLQALEGDPLSVNQLYRNIIVDKRHSEVNLINYSFCLRREFSDWAMQFVDLETISTKKFDADFQPNIPIEEFDPVSALCLLKELSKTLHR